MRDAAGTPPFGIAAAAALLAGVVACLWLPGLMPWPLSVSLLLGAGALWWRRPRWRLAAAFAFGFALAGLHAAHALARQLPGSWDKRDAVVTGRIADLPEHEPRRTRFLFETDRDPALPEPLRGRRLRLSWYDDDPAVRARLLQAGQRWRLQVRLRAPRGLRNPGGADAEKHMLAQRIAATGYVRAPALAERLRAPHGLAAWRERMSLRIAAAVHPVETGAAPPRTPSGAVTPVPSDPLPRQEPAASPPSEREPGAAARERGGAPTAESLGARTGDGGTGPAAADRARHPDASRFIRALALGDTRALDDADWQVLRANGLTHLIAISGFHVGLVAGGFALFARGLWWLWPGLARRWPAPLPAAAAGAFGAALYTAVAGFALPTVRTLLMIAVVASLRLLRRPLRGADALALAAIAVLLVDPLAVLGAGFWLSFLGVAWLLWCLPPQGPRKPLRDFLSAQGVATLGLLPLCVALFGQASLAGPLANLVAVPWWSLVVVPLSLLGLALEALHLGAGAWAWRAAAWCFELSWPLFERFAASGLALWWLPEARWFALPLALLGAFWLLLPRGVPGKTLAVLLWLPLLWPDRRLPREGEAELVVVDVGQGLSVLVRTARHALLYDMGPAVRDGFDAGERAVVPALRALGVRRLDRAVVSHGDNDHAGGLEAVRREFPVADLLAPQEAPVAGARPCIAGQAWRWDGVEFRVLHPGAHFPYLRNESSCVLRVQARHGAALLTGDIGEVIERDLLRRDRAALRAEVVLVAHHGSGGSSDPDFVVATGARLALVASGHGNRFGHPRADVVARWRAAGARVLDTAQGGALRIGLRRGGPVAETRRQAQPRLWDAARRSGVERAGLSYRPDRDG